MAAREKPGPLMSKLETNALSHAFRATKCLTQKFLVQTMGP
jgi:hypothetical protein